MQNKKNSEVKNVEIYDSAKTNDSSILKNEETKSIVKNDLRKTLPHDNNNDNYDEASKLEQLNRLADIIVSIVLSEVN